MSAQITINPYAVTVGNAGLFNVSSDGYRQGTAMPDPSTMFRLRGCQLAASETLPMWGGVGVYMQVPGGAGNPSYALGPITGRAISLTDASKPLAGFSVFDQDYAMITSPQSTVPLIGSGGRVHVYPLGSLARIVVACDPALVDLRGDPINSNVSWDFTNQLLVPYIGTLTMAVAVTFDAGDSITTAGLVGSGSVAELNGTFTALTASGMTVTYQAPTGLTLTISGGSPTLTVGGASDQALPVKVLDVQSSNCETVVYNPATGFAAYNYSGAAALIQI